MKRVLLTGMSGTGKSTVILTLAAGGYRAIDTDSDEWSEWVTAEVDGPIGRTTERDWIWRANRLQHLLSNDDMEVLFVSGCKSNQGTFYSQFDHIILLSAPADVIIQRPATRTNNRYGKSPEELALILQYLQTVEPLLRRGSSLKVDTSVAVKQVIETILGHVQP